jgi:hypothetical protein
VDKVIEIRVFKNPKLGKRATTRTIMDEGINWFNFYDVCTGLWLSDDERDKAFDAIVKSSGSSSMRVLPSISLKGRNPGYDPMYTNETGIEHLFDCFMAKKFWVMPEKNYKKMCKYKEWLVKDVLGYLEKPFKNTVSGNAVSGRRG